MKRKLLAIGVIALVGVLAGSVAYASIPGPDGVIHGCRENNLGLITVIDSAATCPTGWTSVNWNQTGAPGISGYEVVTVSSAASGAFDEERHATAQCPTGKIAIGGGANISNSGTTTQWPSLPVLTVNDHSDNGNDLTAWTVTYQIRPGTVGTVIQARAFCAVVQS